MYPSFSSFLRLGELVFESKPRENENEDYTRDYVGTMLEDSLSVPDEPRP